MKNLILVILFTFALKMFSADYTFSNGYGICFAWADGDKVGIFTSTSVERDFLLLSKIDRTLCSFTGTGFALTGGSQYYSISPYNISYQVAENTAEALPVRFDGQRQTANASLSHLARYDYMSASAVAADEATFKYKHHCGILRLQCKAAKAATFTSVTLEATHGKFATEATLNLIDGVMTPAAEMPSITLNLSDVKVDEGDELIVYMMVAPTDLSAGTVTARFATDAGEEFVTPPLKAPDVEAGRVYCMRGVMAEAQPAAVKAAGMEKKVVSANAPKAVASVSNPQGSADDFLIDSRFVANKFVESLSFQSTYIRFAVGTEQQMSVAMQPVDADNPSLAWTSSNEAVVKVDAQGMMKIVGRGGALVTAATTDGTNLKALCYVEGYSDEESAIDAVGSDRRAAAVYDIGGRRAGSTSSKLIIKRGKVWLNP